ncbi:MAG: glycerophosphodiester phosphodiesterase [Gemmatimonadota bacterium]|nr:glycerophosphodiester phosphodiesterase [Gemmatimonadota bacterium]
MLVAHRGGAGLAPENTLDAFGPAVLQWGADMLEMDVRLSKDGHVVVIHDETVDRTTEGSGRVADLTLADLGSLDAGYRFEDRPGRFPFRGQGVRIPTLEEVLLAFPNMRMNVEAKESRVAGPLVEVVRKHRAQARVLVAAEFERSRREVRGYEGPWGASRHHIFWTWALHRLPRGGFYTPGADILQVPEVWKGLRIVTPRLIEQAHLRNLPVQVWTVDDAQDMRRLLDWGVDGIQSDRPDLLASVLCDRGLRPPPPGLRAKDDEV